MMSDVNKIRNAMIQALPQETATASEKIDEKNVYLPLAHTKALRLSCHLVVGARGVGKSFWTNALADDHIRQQLSINLPELKQLIVYTGYTAKSNPNNYPDQDTFAQLLTQFSAYHIWRAVVFRWILKITDETNRHKSWSDDVSWVQQHPAEFAQLVESANQSLQQQQQQGLIVFDALDLTSDNWQSMDMIAKDLLRVVLWLKSFSHLTAKVFLRADQFARNILNFPDASKLLATKIELTWSGNDLYGLLWQILCNAEGDNGALLRTLYQKIGQLETDTVPPFHVSASFKRNTEEQRRLFALLAGEWMGKDPRRGVPYVWTVSHLADGQGITSPRSFLIALRNATEFSQEKYPDHPLALHYEGIKTGVQQASQVRVTELKEDYWWLEQVTEPLSGITLPCDFSVLEEKWQKAFPRGLENIPDEINHIHNDVDDAKAISRLPIQSSEDGWLGLRNDLEKIGVIKIKKDSRIDMPDLYRVGFGLGRRGGVKPVKQHNPE